MHLEKAKKLLWEFATWDKKEQLIHFAYLSYVGLTYNEDITKAIDKLETLKAFYKNVAEYDDAILQISGASFEEFYYFWHSARFYNWIKKYAELEQIKACALYIFLGTIVDINEYKEAEKAVEKLAELDIEVNGLLNVLWEIVTE